jgi:predicted amidohydrolase
MESKSYCNICGYETKHDENGCVYHQQVLYTDDGEQYFRYDEFNQDGEEW